MDPESNSPEADVVVDHIDVVALKEEEEEQQPPEEQPEELVATAEIEIPLQQERRLEDVRRVRDEAQSLRHEICQLRIRLEEVEEESKFHAAKANELTELLMNGHSSSGNSGIDDTILKQSEELARKACQIETLEKKITNLTTEKALLEIKRNDAKKETAELSKVVRSLQSVNDKSNRSYCEDDDESEESEEIVLTPETALDLTLGNLKEHIEMLEDGLQASSSLNTAQKEAIVSLEQDNHVQQGKIVVLEELFRELNTNDRLIYKDEQQKEDSQETGSSSSSSVPKEGLIVRFRNPFTSMVAYTSTSTEEKPEIPEEGRVEKFKKSRIGSFKSMVTSANASASTPEIPEEAAAAAQAAAFLVGNDSKDGQPQKTSTTPSKKRRNMAMKKVKIRFKKAGLEGTYTGPLVDRKPHGVGTIRFSNGDTYLGEMTRGKMSGTGTLYTKSKGVFRGQFENNKFVGELQPTQAEAQEENHEAPSDGDSDSGSNNNPAAEPIAPVEKACDATATTVETSEEEEENSRANAMAALELDGFSPTTITGSQDVAEGIDDSFNMQADLDGMERKTEIAEIQKYVARRENENFLKEFSGSEESSSSSTVGGLDESFASSLDEEPPAISM